MNARVCEIVFSGAPVSSPARSRAMKIAGEDTRAPQSFRFITYAVEIEGDAPLIFSIEAVDE